jgi:predicted nucleotidyltransferase
MRLTLSQADLIRTTAQQLLGEQVRVTLFGSRVDDAQKGGDVDLLVETTEDVVQPALLSAQISARISRAMQGRRVDVVLCAPNLMPQAIHQVARETGVLL